MNQPFTYLVINKTTKLAYYGVRFSKYADPDKFWVKDKYRTSSKLVNALINQFGEDDFIYEVRRTFKTIEDAIKWEATVNRRLTVKSNKFLNIDNNQMPHRAIQIREKCMRISHIESKTCITVPINFEIPPGWVLGNINLRAANIPRIKRKWITNTKTGECRMVHFDSVFSEDWIQGKRPKSHSNAATLKARKLFWITDGTTKVMISPADPMPPGWRRGAYKSAQERESNLRSLKATIGCIYITDGKTKKRIRPGDEIPEGWWKGAPKLPSPLAHKMFITDGKTKKPINLTDEIPEGWTRLRKIYTPKHSKN